MTTPVLFIVFNRPETTRRVFESIRQAKPKQLFVAADGPRPGKEGDRELCEAVRKIAVNVDWDCEVRTLFRIENRGCGVGPSEAITWFFNQVEYGIILEDDCVASPFFFTFCSELLVHYSKDESVMHISGNNFSFLRSKPQQPYFFNYFFTAWGWATWRRAWEKYDFNITALDEFYSSKKLDSIALTNRQHKYWIDIFERVRDGKRKDIWDYQWIFCCWRHNAFAITPPVNLVTNIGFDEDATHTIGEVKVSYMPTVEIKTIVHPERKERNEKLDNLIYRNYYEPPQHLNYIRNFLYKIFPSVMMRPLRILRRKVFPNIK